MHVQNCPCVRASLSLWRVSAGILFQPPFVTHILCPKQVNAVSGRPWRCQATSQESSRRTPPPDLLSALDFWGRGGPVRLQFFSCQA